MRFAYADPPYLGCGKLYAEYHPDAMDWNDPETHRRLVERLCADYPDGWALSCHTPSLRVLLPFTPADCRVAAWVKPFAVFKPNVNPAYAWEPVLFRGGRKRDRTQDTVRDWHSENITLRKGLPGAKPPKFADWILGLLGVDFKVGDTIDDLYPGTHGMTLAWNARRDHIDNTKCPHGCPRWIVCAFCLAGVPAATSSRLSDPCPCTPADRVECHATPDVNRPTNCALR